LPWGHARQSRCRAYRPLCRAKWSTAKAGFPVVHRLLRAAGSPPTRTYAIYTPGSGDTPTSRRRSGRRRRRIDRITRRRGGSRGFAQKIANRTLAGVGDGPRSVFFIKRFWIESLVEIGCPGLWPWLLRHGPISPPLLHSWLLLPLYVALPVIIFCSGSYFKSVQYMFMCTFAVFRTCIIMYTSCLQFPLTYMYFKCARIYILYQKTDM
jgi:hypothetical protein